MIQIKTELIQNVPVLHVTPAESANELAPTVVFLHGFTSSKEQNLSYAYLLAQNGIRVLLPDFPSHGDRVGSEQVGDLNWKFWDIVIEGIRELEQIVHYYINAGVIDSERIGVVGTSMGGIAMFGALTQFEWIKLSVSLMGTPKYEAFARLMVQTFQQQGVDIPLSRFDLDQRIAALKPYDLSQKPDLIGGRPMLIWHGEVDSVVPCVLTKTFYNDLKNQIPSNLLDVHMIIDPNTGHKVPRDVCHQVVNWIVDRL